MALLTICAHTNRDTGYSPLNLLPTQIPRLNMIKRSSWFLANLHPSKQLQRLCRKSTSKPAWWSSRKWKAGLLPISMVTSSARIKVTQPGSANSNLIRKTPMLLDTPIKIKPYTTLKGSSRVITQIVSPMTCLWGTFLKESPSTMPSAHSIQRAYLHNTEFSFKRNQVLLSYSDKKSKQTSADTLISIPQLLFSPTLSKYVFPPLSYLDNHLL